MAITINKSTSGAYFTVQLTDTAAPEVYASNSAYLTVDPNTQVVFLKSATIEDKIIFSDLATNIIDGDTDTAFASLEDLTDYVSTNFFRKATGGGGGGSTAFADITGAPTDNTALASALAAKVNTSRTINSKPLTSNVVLDKTDIGLTNVDNTADTAKPVSTAQQTAINLKADSSTVTAHTSNVSNPHSVTKAQVGLGSVDNTTDLAKPISTLTQTALNLKADLTLGKVPVSQLPAVIFGEDFRGTATSANPLTVADDLMTGLQFLGSPLKGFSVGLNPFLISGTSFALATGNYYGGLVRLYEDATLTGIAWMLTASGAYTASNENRIGLYTYDKAGSLTLVASTANNGTLYSQTSGNNLQEAFSTPYAAKAGYYFVAFIYSSSAQTTAPSLLGASFGLQNKSNMLMTNSAKIVFKSLSAGKTALPSSISFSTDTNVINTIFWVGLY